MGKGTGFRLFVLISSLQKKNGNQRSDGRLLPRELGAWSQRTTRGTYLQGKSAPHTYLHYAQRSNDKESQKRSLLDARYETILGDPGQLYGQIQIGGHGYKQKPLPIRRCERWIWYEVEARRSPMWSLRGYWDAKQGGEPESRYERVASGRRRRRFCVKRRKSHAWLTCRGNTLSFGG